MIHLRETWHVPCDTPGVLFARVLFFEHKLTKVVDQLQKQPPHGIPRGFEFEPRKACHTVESKMIYVNGTLKLQTGPTGQADHVKRKEADGANMFHQSIFQNDIKPYQAQEVSLLVFGLLARGGRRRLILSGSPGPLGSWLATIGIGQRLLRLNWLKELL